jgi:hypothetical protein
LDCWSGGLANDCAKTCAKLNAQSPASERRECRQIDALCSEKPFQCRTSASVPSPGKCVYGKTVTWVRIPPHPLHATVAAHRPDELGGGDPRPSASVTERRRSSEVRSYSVVRPQLNTAAASKDALEAGGIPVVPAPPAQRNACRNSSSPREQRPGLRVRMPQRIGDPIREKTSVVVMNRYSP